MTATSRNAFPVHSLQRERILTCCIYLFRDFFFLLAIRHVIAETMVMYNRREGTDVGKSESNLTRAIGGRIEMVTTHDRKGEITVGSIPLRMTSDCND